MQTDSECGNRPEKITLQLVLLGINAALGGFMFGYDTGSIGGALLQLKRPSSTSACPGLEPYALSVLQQEIIVASVVFGAFLSSSLAGIVSSRFGRQRAILCAAIFLACGSALMGLAGSVVTMVAARLVTGLGVGLASHSVPLYISECAPSSMRGCLCFINDLMIVVGQIAAAGISLGFFYFEVNEGWRYILGLATVPALAMLFGFLMQPESPRWLASQHEKERARTTLAMLRGLEVNDKDLQAEFQDMLDGVESESRVSSGRDLHAVSLYHTFWKDVRVRRALLLGCGLQFLQQWAGVNTIMYYGAVILQSSGPAYDVRSNTCFTSENIRDIRSTLFFAFSQAAGILISCRLVDSYGRRLLILSSLTGVVITLTALGFAFHAQTVSQTAVVASIMLYLLSFGIGLSPIPWTVNAEIYPTSVRSACISMSTSTNWLMNFVVSVTYLSCARALSTNSSDPGNHPDGIFWIYATIALAGLLLLWWKMPETRGIPLEEMGAVFVDPREYHAE